MARVIPPRPEAIWMHAEERCQARGRIDLEAELNLLPRFEHSIRKTELQRHSVADKLVFHSRL